MLSRNRWSSRVSSTTSPITGSPVTNTFPPATFAARSDSPEAFYSCSDVVFGGDGSGSGGENSEGGIPDGGAAPAPSASAPTEEQIEEGADNSAVEHHGHGDQDAGTPAEPAAADSRARSAPADRPKAAGATGNLAETGGNGGTVYLATGGAATLALGAAVLFMSVRRRAAGGHHGR